MAAYPPGPDSTVRAIPAKPDNGYRSPVLLQITAAPDADLIAAATRHRLRRPVLLARSAGWLLLALALVEPSLLVGGVVLAVAFPVLLLNGAARRAARTDRLTTYQISAGGVASSSSEDRHAYAWRAFRSVEALSGQLLLGLRNGRYVRIPTGGLTTWQVEQVLGTAAAQGLPVRRA